MLFFYEPLKELLIFFLHLDDELFTTNGAAINIEHRPTFRSLAATPRSSGVRNFKSMTWCFSGNNVFKKSMSKSLFASSPNNFLKQKSV